MNERNFFDGYLDMCLGLPFDYERTSKLYETGRQFALLWDIEKPAYNKDGTPTKEALKELAWFMKNGII